MWLHAVVLVDLAEALLPDQVAAAQRSKWLAGGLEASEFWQFGWYNRKLETTLEQKILQNVYPTTQTQAKHSSFSFFVALLLLVASFRLVFLIIPILLTLFLFLSFPASAIEGPANTKHRNLSNSGGNTESSAGNSIVRIPLASTLECSKAELQLVG